MEHEYGGVYMLVGVLSTTEEVVMGWAEEEGCRGSRQDRHVKEANIQTCKGSRCTDNEWTMGMKRWRIQISNKIEHLEEKEDLLEKEKKSFPTHVTHMSHTYMHITYIHT